MNRSLRRTHLRRFGLLAVLLPVGISAALISRPEVTSTNETAQVTGEEKQDTKEVSERAMFTTVEGLSVELSVTQFSHGGPQHFAKLIPSTPLALPDVLVYWSEGLEVPKAGDKLPSNVSFMGEFSGDRSAVFPIQDSDSKGVLVLFSLAHGEVVDALRLNEAGDAQ